VIFLSNIWFAFGEAVTNIVGSKTNIIDFSRIPKGNYPGNKAFLVSLVFGHLMNYLYAKHLSPFWAFMLIPIGIYIGSIIFGYIKYKVDIFKSTWIFIKTCWWLVLGVLAMCLFFQWRLNTTGSFL
jgi:hypothetical protein